LHLIQESLPIRRAPQTASDRGIGAIMVAVTPADSDSIHELRELPLHAAPPSPTESPLYTITRNQHSRLTHRLKFTSEPSAFQSLSNDWEFAGWGKTEYIHLSDQEIEAARQRRAQEVEQRVLGQWTASAIAGNDVVGSPIYSIPAVVAVSSV
jgi:hypothetical protein